MDLERKDPGCCGGMKDGLKAVLAGIASLTGPGATGAGLIAIEEGLRGNSDHPIASVTAGTLETFAGTALTIGGVYYLSKYFFCPIKKNKKQKKE